MLKENSTVKALLFVLTIILFGCTPITESLSTGHTTQRPFRVSIRNKTNHDLTAKLVVGKIPARNAPYTEFEPFSYEEIRGFNDNYDEGAVTYCVIKKGKNNYVTTWLWLQSMNIANYPPGAFVLNKLISFTLTISDGDQVIHRIAGWDIPESDRDGFNIDETMYGYYDTYPDGWINDIGQVLYDPLFYSKLWGPDRIKFPNRGITYYIDVKADNGVRLVEISNESWDYRFDKYWKEH